MTDKYVPLHDYLAAAAQRGDDTVQLRLDEIAKLVGGLPPSAHKYRAWWSNGSQDHAAAWMDAGWNVAVVSQPDGFVRFEREADPIKPAAGGTSGSGDSDRSAGPSATRNRNAVLDAATLPLLEKVHVRVAAEWRDAGPIALDSDGELHFPRLSSVPGLYRMTLSGALGQTRPRIYIGETGDVRGLVSNYRNPGSTQETNRRLNAKLKAHFAEGGVASLAIATSVAAELGQPPGETFKLDLSRKASRLLGENAALVTAQLAGDTDIENLE